MTTRKPLAAFALAGLLALAACGNDDAPAPATSSSTSVASMTSKAPTTSEKATATPTTTTTDAAPPAPEAEPELEQYVPAPPAQQTPDSVFNAPGNGYQCPGTDAFVNSPSDCTSANLGGDPAYDSIYPGGAAPAQTRQPSPWVQGQIDWANCKAEGNTDEQCRSMLN